MTFCPFCGVRQDVDLRQIHFRDLGSDETMTCPCCETPLGVIEFKTTPAIRIERCTTCQGMFFNPGELEALLDLQTNPLVWLDQTQLHQISADFGFHHEVVYRKCPMCADRMSHLNFAGRSGVVLDRCGTHGVWVEGGELRRLTEWWRAGGKLVFQQNEKDKTGRLFQTKGASHSASAAASVDSQEHADPWTWSSGGGILDATELLAAAVEMIVSCVTD